MTDDLTSERTEISVGITSSFTSVEIQNSLIDLFLNDSQYSLKSTIGGFNVFDQALRAPICIDNKPVDIEVHIYFVEHLLRDKLTKYLNSESIEIEGVINGLINSVVALSQRASSSSVRVLLCIDTLLSLGTFESQNPLESRRTRSLLSKIQNLIFEKLELNSNVYFVPLNEIILKHDRGLNVDFAREYLHRNPLPSKASHEMAHSILEFIKGSLNKDFKKVIVLDCDNTLWGGLVGEDGLNGIQIGDDYPGRCFRDFQVKLKSLSNQGYLLCICSKNNLDDVRDVFEKHDAMILKWENFVAHRVNWDSKSTNIKSISKELNLGLDSFVFVDDSSWEVNEVASNCIGVDVFQVPSDLELLPTIFSDYSKLKSYFLTSEDLLRTTRMNDNLKRKRQLDNLNSSNSHVGLNLELSFMTQTEFERVLQLIHKTNQFNLTSIRLDANQLSHFANDPTNKVVVARAGDNFGDYGLIAVALISNFNSQTWIFENYIFSCRALSRDLEYAFIKALLLRFGSEIEAIQFKSQTTSKNVPAMMFLDSLDIQGGLGIRQEIELKILERSLENIKVGWADGI